MAITAIRTAIIYLFLIAALRVTGKRQLGELQPIELVVTLLISDLASVPMQESGTPLLTGLIPIAVLVALELVLSALMMKSSGLARLISGNPIVIVKNGQVSVNALRRLRLTMEDLLEALRQQDIFDLRDVQYAIAETNGQISVFRVQNPPQTAAVPLVSDGKTVEWALRMTGITEQWIRKTLDRHHCTMQDTLLLAADSKRQYYLIRKGERPS